MPLHVDRTNTAIALEVALAAAGLAADAVLVWRCALSPDPRPARSQSGIGPWPGNGSDLLLLLLFVLGGVLLASGLAGFVLRAASLSEDAKLVFGIGVFQTGLFLGIASFHFGWRSLGGSRECRPLETLRDGTVVFLVALPVIYAVAYLWRLVLGAFGVPIAVQTTLDIFTNLHSNLLRIVFSFLAIVIAPIAEEFIFRAGLFRFCLGRFPYWAAVLVPAALFGGAHLLTSPMENLPTLGPLIALGAIFSIAYERTGRIGTTIVAHALFNLNTVLLVLAGINV